MVHYGVGEDSCILGHLSSGLVDVHFSLLGHADVDGFYECGLIMNILCVHACPYVCVHVCADTVVFMLLGWPWSL